MEASDEKKCCIERKGESMEGNYIKALEESLWKKSHILSEIILKNEEQKKNLEEESFQMLEFDKIVDEKSALIKELLRLDSGFQIVYDKIRRMLEEEKSKYKQEIESMQKLIKEITDKSVQIQVEEARNRVLVEAKFRQERMKYKKGRTTSKAALKYYKNMSRTNLVDPQFLDKKK